MSKQDHNIQSIDVNLGEVFKIELKGDESAGYIWALTKLPANLYLLNDNYRPASHLSPISDSSGSKSFFFKAIGENVEGEHLVFSELLPWAGIEKKRMEWKVEVSKNGAL